MDIVTSRTLELESAADSHYPQIILNILTYLQIVADIHISVQTIVDLANIHRSFKLLVSMSRTVAIKLEVTENE